MTGALADFLIFLFGSGAGKREEASEQVAGGRFLIENRGRGGNPKEAGWGCMRHEDVWRERGGAKFFSGGGSETPTKELKWQKC